MKNNIILGFLSDLSNNNTREWFEENKNRYLEAKEQMEFLVNQVIHKVAEFDASVADQNAKKSIFRIYRDVRFSKNKDPYKTNMGGFVVPGGKNSGKAGYYIHMEPGNSFLAGGIYCPESNILKQIRDEVLYSMGDFKQILSNSKFQKTFGDIQGEKLKKPPKGFPADHEDIELLKFKSYTVIHSISDDKFGQDDFVDYAAEVFKVMKPFNQFLNQAFVH